MSAFIRVTLGLALASAFLAHAQSPLSAKELVDIDHLFDSRDPGNALPCDVVHFDPYLDFTFRYDAGFSVSVPLSQLRGDDNLKVYLRTISDDGKHGLLSKTFDVSAIDPEIARKLKPKQLKKIVVQLSAAFAMGEGRYRVDFLLMDSQQHSCRKRWSLKTPHHNAQLGILALPPNTVAPIDEDLWDGKLDSKGIRLTVLLHVAPINPYASKLHAWDYAFLLQSLASLLKQLPSRSVQVIAFNLDQQQEVFHEEHFDRKGYERLSQTLHKLEFATVSYQALRRGRWQHWLANLANEQTNKEQVSDVVVFLGPTSRFTNKISGDAPIVGQKAPHLFYLEFYPLASDFSDSIDFLTRGMGGTVYKIHSADSLGLAIQKMLEKVKPTQSNVSVPGAEGAGSN